MKHSRVIFCFLAVVPVAFSQQREPLRDVPSVSSKRQAFYYYTSAVHEDDDSARMKLFTRAIESDPTLYRAYYNRGVLFANDNALDKAEADFLKTTELHPGYINAHYNLACVRAMAQRKPEALSALAATLQAGYRNFDKLKKDQDLASIASSVEFSQLVSRFEKAAATTMETSLQKLQIISVDERLKVILSEIEEPSEAAAEIAEWCMYEGDYRARVFAMQLWRAIDAKGDDKKSLQQLAMGLYDVNGYVCKAAGNLLVSHGKEIVETVRPILEDSELEAPLFAMQILAKVDARDCASAIAPYLKHDKPNTRITAAQSLAQLRAKEALPEIKAALENLPKEEDRRRYYQLSIRLAIEALQADSQTPCNEP